LLIEHRCPATVDADELLTSTVAVSPADKAAARLVLHGSADRAAHRAAVLGAASPGR
jgi:hypothetical protein